MILAAASLGVLSKAGVDVPATVILGVPAALALLAFFIHRAQVSAPAPHPSPPTARRASGGRRDVAYSPLTC